MNRWTTPVGFRVGRQGIPSRQWVAGIGLAEAAAELGRTGLWTTAAMLPAQAPALLSTGVEERRSPRSGSPWLPRR